MTDLFKNVEMNAEGAPEVTPEQVKEAMASLKLIDVRQDDEFSGELGHIEGAVNSTLQTNFKNDLSSLDKNEIYIFICRSGCRSTAATKMAQEAGFKSVYNMKGGMLRWNALGFPIK